MPHDRVKSLASRFRLPRFFHLIEERLLVGTSRRTSGMGLSEVPDRDKIASPQIRAQSCS